MYQDDRFIPCDLPPCDCLPDRDYPENPDWLWFFEQINDALSEVQNIDQVIAQVKANQKAIKILQDNQYRLPVAASAILGGVKADPVTPEDKQPVHIDAGGKLWTAEGGKGEVESVNGKKGVVHLTAEDVGALPDDTPIPPAYNLPTASGAILGGVKADAAHSDDTQPVRIGTDNKLYTKPGTGGGGSGGDNEVSVQLSTEPVPPEAEIVVFTDEQNPLTLEDVTGAQPGDLIRITSVDEKGVPTALEPVDMPGGGNTPWEKVSYGELKAASMIEIDQDMNGKPFELRAAWVYVHVPGQSGVSGEDDIYVFAKRSNGDYLALHQANKLDLATQRDCTILLLRMGKWKGFEAQDPYGPYAYTRLRTTCYMGTTESNYFAENIKNLRLTLGYNRPFPVGTNFEIWGQTA